MEWPLFFFLLYGSIFDYFNIYALTTPTALFFAQLVNPEHILGGRLGKAAVMVIKLSILVNKRFGFWS